MSNRQRLFSAVGFCLPLALYWIGGGDLATRSSPLAVIVFFSLSFGFAGFLWATEIDDQTGGE